MGLPLFIPCERITRKLPPFADKVLGLGRTLK
jgi:hypothetical protein